MIIYLIIYRRAIDIYCRNVIRVKTDFGTQFICTDNLSQHGGTAGRATILNAVFEDVCRTAKSLKC